MIILFLILLVLTTIYFYIGFIHKTDPYSKSRSQGAFFILLFLNVIIAFAVYREFTAENEISHYIVPYSGELTAIYTPPILGSDSQVWQFTTPDSVKQVEQFYTKIENIKGWKTVSQFPFMTLRKGDKEMVISVIKLKKSSITYTLRTITTPNKD